MSLNLTTTCIIVYQFVLIIKYISSSLKYNLFYGGIRSITLLHIHYIEFESALRQDKLCDDLNVGMQSTAQSQLLFSMALLFRHYYGITLAHQGLHFLGSFEREAWKTIRANDSSSVVHSI